MVAAIAFTTGSVSSDISPPHQLCTRFHPQLDTTAALFDGDVVEEKSAIAFAVWWPLLSGGFAATGLVSEGFDLGLCKNSSSFQKISSGSEVSLQGKQHCHSKCQPWGFVEIGFSEIELGISGV
ncbi:hypothetical protein V8G54_018514 [Vigna mungo]|uniref:Uncharacterized protein n=1 Tax=Vigna mungo TaxID=3915 RepID=A0AAQ3N9Q7_VIGMU